MVQKRGFKTFSLDYINKIQMQINKTTSKLSRLCREQLKEEGKTISRIKTGIDENPFPIGITNLENIYYDKGLSIKLQIKLAEYFNLSIRLVLEDN